MNPVAEMLLNDPTPAAIWATLMLLCLPAVFFLASPQSLRYPRLAVLDVAAATRRRGELRRQERAQAVEILRYADEMKVAADQAIVAAQRWAERRDRAGARTNAAWQAWQHAGSELTRLQAAAAYANPWTAPTPAAYAERERYLHRIVGAAVTRGDLPASALAGALAGEGWDATLHQFDQDVALARAIAAHRQECYRLATAAELTASHDAQLAVRSRDSLRREWVAAVQAATQVHHLAPASRPAARSTRLAVRARVA